MKVPIFLLWYIFLYKLLTDFQVDARCYFQYGTNREDHDDHLGHCFCGPENQTVSFFEGKYCCVKNQDTCKVKEATKPREATKLCPNATVLYGYQPCHGTCTLDKIQCSSNPNHCMDNSLGGLFPVCDGQHRLGDYEKHIFPPFEGL